jgi:hypothetical protein
MGKQNRQRRAAKKRKHQQPTGDRPAPPRNPFHDHTDEPFLTAQEKVEGILELAATALRRGDYRFGREAAVTLKSFDATLVAHEAERAILRCIDALWHTGWQPAELARHVRRSTTAPAAKLVPHAIAADHADRGPKTLDPRWIAQLDRLDLPREASRSGWLRPWTLTQGIE